MAISYALVLTGEVLPGFAPDAVWPQLAAMVRMEPEKFAQLLAQTPRTIKQESDSGKLQKLQEGIAKIGAQTEICLTDERPALYVQVDGTPRGPMPRTLVQQRVQRGRWPETITVAEVGAQRWHSFREYEAVIAPPALIAPQTLPPAEPAAAPTRPAYASAVRDDDDHPALAGAKYLAATNKAQPAAGVRTYADADSGQTGGLWGELPTGGAIHAGFWRRVAAYWLDGLLFGLIGVGVYIVALILMFLAPFLGVIFWFLAFFGLWFWYYPWSEGAGPQATFGKRAFGIKVVDRRGEAIGRGRAFWRRLSQILIPLIGGVFTNVYFFISVGPTLKKLAATKNPDPSAVFNSVFNSSAISTLITMGVVLYSVWALTFMMAGWTRRKQTLYDKLSGAFVVFDEVQPGQRLPRQRPPMPWYGWLINVLVSLWILGAVTTIPLFLAIAKNMPVQMKVMEAVTAATAIQGEIAQHGCKAGERPLPNPALGKAEVTSGILGVCKITLTLADSDNTPADLRGSEIEWTREGDGQWRCSSDLPEKYLPPMFCRR